MIEFVVFVVILIVAALVKKVGGRPQTPSGPPSPRMQKMIDRIQAAQQAAGRPVQGQFTRPVSGRPLPQPNPAQTFPAPNQQPAQSQYQPPSTWIPSYGPPPARPQPAHRPPQNKLPTPTNDLDARVRELVAAGNEVSAVRLLCDERDLDILQAQNYARSLVAPASKPTPETSASSAVPETTASSAVPDEEESRYVGSAAFAESIFDLDRDEEVWASGWTEPKDEDDRSDIDELWQTVRNQGRPPTT